MVGLVYIATHAPDVLTAWGRYQRLKVENDAATVTVPAGLFGDPELKQKLESLKAEKKQLEERLQRAKELAATKP